MPTDRVLIAERVVLPDRVAEPGWLTVRAGLITGAGSGILPGRGDEVIPGWLVPGFVDQHIHGGGGAAFETDNPAAAETVVQTHLRHGTTSMIASLVSASVLGLPEQVGRLVDQCETGLLAGIHLEGPWLSPLHKGAHDPVNLRNPTVEELEAVLAVGKGYIRMITIAPELPGAMDVIRACAANDVVAAVGHTDADYDQTVAAIDAGATAATHLFNAMSPLHHRDPGPIAALVEDPRVSVEMIIDGIHVHASAARMARLASEGRVILHTDAMAAAGFGDGDYVLGSLAVEVRDGTARLVEGGAIAGSTLTMDSAFRRYVHDCGASVVEAVAASATRPAHLMRLDDRGELRVGRRADICNLDSDLELGGVWLQGESVDLG
jgi:N-acetylglucosamine-6-phosphate deacetylase